MRDLNADLIRTSSRLSDRATRDRPRRSSILLIEEQGIIESNYTRHTADVQRELDLIVMPARNGSLKGIAYALRRLRWRGKYGIEIVPSSLAICRRWIRRSRTFWMKWARPTQATTAGVTAEFMIIWMQNTLRPNKPMHLTSTPLALRSREVMGDVGRKS